MGVLSASASPTVGALQPSRIQAPAWPPCTPPRPFQNLTPRSFFPQPQRSGLGRATGLALTLSSWFSTILILFRVLAFWSRMTPGALGSFPQAKSRASHSWIWRKESGAWSGLRVGEISRPREMRGRLRSCVLLAPATLVAPIPSPCCGHPSSPHLPRGSGFHHNGQPCRPRTQLCSHSDRPPGGPVTQAEPACTLSWDLGKTHMSWEGGPPRTGAVTAFMAPSSLGQ